MDDTTPAEGAPAAPDATPQAGTTPPAADATDAPAAPQAPEVTPEVQHLIDEAAKAASRKANAEAQAMRKRMKELEDAEQARKDADLSELEKAQKAAAEAAERATTAEARARAATLQAAITAEATRVGINPELALKLAANDVTFDDAGNPDNTAAVLDALATAHPNLVQQTRVPTQSPTNPGRTDAPPMSDVERLAAERKARSQSPQPWWAGGGVVT